MALKTAVVAAQGRSFSGVLSLHFAAFVVASYIKLLPNNVNCTNMRCIIELKVMLKILEHIVFGLPTVLSSCSSVPFAFLFSTNSLSLLEKYSCIKQNICGRISHATKCDELSKSTLVAIHFLWIGFETSHTLIWVRLLKVCSMSL